MRGDLKGEMQKLHGHMTVGGHGWPWKKRPQGGWGVGAGGWDWGEVMLQQWHLMEEPGSQAPQHQIAERHQP